MFVSQNMFSPIVDRTEEYFTHATIQSVFLQILHSLGQSANTPCGENFLFQGLRGKKRNNRPPNHQHFEDLPKDLHLTKDTRDERKSFQRTIHISENKFARKIFEHDSAFQLPQTRSLSGYHFSVSLFHSLLLKPYVACGSTRPVVCPTPSLHMNQGHSPLPHVLSATLLRPSNDKAANGLVVTHF